MSPRQDSVAGVILAAGEGSRVGRNKALLEIEGVKFIERIARSLQKVGCRPVLVVGGADADSVEEEARRLGVRFAMNADWRLGQFSSLRVGVSHLGPEVMGAMVALVDHPLVADETYGLLLEAFRSSPGKIIIPRHEGRRGHPVVVPRQIMEEVIASPDDFTLRNIMKKHKHLIVEQEVDDGHILTDIDTEEGLKRVGGRTPGER